MCLVGWPLTLEVEATGGAAGSGLTCAADVTTVLASGAPDPVRFSGRETGPTSSGFSNRPRKIGVDVVLGPFFVFSDSFD